MKKVHTPKKKVSGLVGFFANDDDVKSSSSSSSSSSDDDEFRGIGRATKRGTKEKAHKEKEASKAVIRAQQQANMHRVSSREGSRERALALLRGRDVSVPLARATHCSCSYSCSCSCRVTLMVSEVCLLPLRCLLSWGPAGIHRHAATFETRKRLLARAPSRASHNYTMSHIEIILVDIP